MAVCMLTEMAACQKRMSEIQLPFYVVHGDEDALCELSGSKLLNEKASSQDKTLQVRKGSIFT